MSNQNICLHCLGYTIVRILRSKICFTWPMTYRILSYDVTSGSEITPCNTICKPLVVYRFTGNVMASITTLRHIDKIITFLRQK